MENGPRGRTHRHARTRHPVRRRRPRGQKAASDRGVNALKADSASEQRQDRRRGPGLNITELKDKSIQQLTQIAKDLNVAGATGMRNRS